MRSTLLWILSVVHLGLGQKTSSGTSGSEKGFLLNRRPLFQHQQQQGGVPCWTGGGGHYDGYDSVEEDERGRKLLLAAGAAIGGAALGYHLGMKHQNQPIINNNIYNEIPSPCVVVQGGGGGGGGSWAGSSSGTGGGGIVGGILGNHPILSNILQNGPLGNGGVLPWGGGNGGGNGGGGALANRQNSINWNRAIRQFNRAIRPITRGFK